MTAGGTGVRKTMDARERERQHSANLQVSTSSGRRRNASESSDTATIHFLTDDRMHSSSHAAAAEEKGFARSFREKVYIDENGKVSREVDSWNESYGDRHQKQHSGLRRLRYEDEEHSRGNRRRAEEEGDDEERYGEYDEYVSTDNRGMAVDYSASDFGQSRAAIDAASRDGVRVRRRGDTTVMTEHRDPYSFYWQLDQDRRDTESPPRRPPPTDYVVDEEEELPETVLSPDSGVNLPPPETQYSRPTPREPSPLPQGWEKHQDPSGFSYYWHVDSGTIQREPPQRAATPPSPPPAPVYAPPSLILQHRETQADAPSPPPAQIIQLPPQQPVIEEHAFKQTTTKRRVDQSAESDGEDDGEPRGRTVRFAVRSLGWTEIAESELTAEKSSRAVNRAIVELSGGLGDGVSKWGDGRELIMELDDDELRLIEPDSMQVLHSERVPHIRVWGVGRDNARDFAYVARDRASRRFMCHVFRCDTPAKTIANTLRDICRRLMVHRRPSSLQAIENGTVERRVVRSELATPNDEPRKIVRCHFLGVTQVPKATGIEILNEAVDRLVSQVRPERWILSDVAIAPSTITISEVNGPQIAQCRVRYLSFLGIGRDIKHCAFIMHTSGENFLCYVFHVEPSAGGMAKMIEAACKLRYQKVLDAHAGRSAHAALPAPPGMD